KNPHYGNSRRVSREPEKYHANIQARSPRYSSSTSRKHSRDYEYRRPSTSLGPSYGIRRTLHAKVKKVKFEEFNRISLEDSHLLQRKSPEVTSSRSYAPNPSEGMYGLSTDAIATNRIR
uniref:Uncharacterized protein n=1 Tax=Ciona savignyi TaxID=51511 RepID=H2YD08_CIOSA